MNYNDIDEIALVVLEIFVEQNLKGFTEIINKPRGTYPQEYIENRYKKINPKKLVEEAYEFALAFREEGRKHYSVPVYHKEEKTT